MSKYKSGDRVMINEKYDKACSTVFGLRGESWEGSLGTVIETPPDRLFYKVKMDDVAKGNEDGTCLFEEEELDKVLES